MSGTTTHTAELVESGFSLLEAPRWHAGSLYASDFFTHRVLRWNAPVGRKPASTVCDIAGQPSGLGFATDGSLRVVSMLEKRLYAVDDSGTRQVADFSDLVSGPGNDLTLDSAGRCFIGNFGLDVDDPDVARPTPLLRVDPDGSVSVAAEDLLFPNGMVFTEDETTLLVAETYRCRITAFDVEDGVLGARRTWAEFAPLPSSFDIPAATRDLPILPDGIALDAEGALWVADAKGHGAVRVREGGEILESVDTGELTAYSMVLGGPGLTTLYLTCAPPSGSFDPASVRRSSLLRCTVGVPGAPVR